jgi:mannose-6-phosphate isomerase-like protein (cupin superfamily)
MLSVLGMVLFSWFLGLMTPLCWRHLRNWRGQSEPLQLGSGGHELVTKPWGREEIWAQSPYYVGKILVIQAGESLSQQYHKVKDETLLVLEGRLTLEVERGDETAKVILHPRDTYRITPGTIHRMVAADGAVKLVEVSTPELWDVVRLSDKYGRVL